MSSSLQILSLIVCSDSLKKHKQFPFTNFEFHPHCYGDSSHNYQSYKRGSEIDLFERPKTPPKKVDFKSTRLYFCVMSSVAKSLNLVKPDYDAIEQYNFKTKLVKEGFVRLINEKKTFYNWKPYPGSEVTILYLHGLADTCSDNKKFQRYCSKRKLSYFSYDFFTFGKSEGYDSNHENYLMTDHIKQSIEMIIYARNNFFPDQKLILYGKGYGGQIAVLLLYWT